MLTALQLMNSKNMIHRDLKPENIVIINDNPNNFKVCLLDFGFVCWTNESREILTAACGTPGFIAPEIFTHEKCSHKSDIFSLGCILYTLIRGYSLYPGKDSDQIMHYNKSLDPISCINFSTLSTMSQQFQDLLIKMLSKDPK
jgi:serine/threonine protein kinase